MSDSKQVLVFGATGQQGGSVAAALLKAGWGVRALVRDPDSASSVALREAGAEIAQGTFADTDSMRRAMQGVYGVFSIQPSSPGGTVTDEEEERYGKVIADLAVESGVQHLVYTSTVVVGDEPTGLGHFESKSHIEQHIRTLPITATIVRPATFMELLTMPGFGLDENRFNFFMRPEQEVQLIAVEDIGKIVAAVFADPARFGGKTFDIASDAVTGQELESLFTEAAGRPITYARFSNEVLAANPFLQKITALAGAGRLTGQADLEALREVNPELQSFRSWLAGSGREAFEAALGTGGDWKYNQA
ncbi:NmrA/HSCARG family protein [bacterium]|nr:MAG: NmrA/HSCARG family protein [bacterium]